MNMGNPTRNELLMFCRDVKRTCERARCGNWHPTTEDQREIVRLADWAGNYTAEADAAREVADAARHNADALRQHDTKADR